MRIVAVALALAYPLWAGAVPVYIDYEGSVSDVKRIGCGCEFARLPAEDRQYIDYSVGDTVKGRFIYDTDTAPHDNLAFDPTMGRYGGDIYDVMDFISGGGPPSTHPTLRDVVLIADREDGVTQRYSVQHYWNISRADTTLQYAVAGFSFDMITTRSDLIRGDGLVQSFDTAPDHKTRITALLETVFEGAHGLFGVNATVALKRLTVTSPGSCHR